MADTGTSLTTNTIIPLVWDAHVLQKAHSELEKYVMQFEPKKIKPLVVIMVDK